MRRACTVLAVLFSGCVFYDTAAVKLSDPDVEAPDATMDADIPGDMDVGLGDMPPSDMPPSDMPPADMRPPDMPTGDMPLDMPPDIPPTDMPQDMADAPLVTSVQRVSLVLSNASEASAMLPTAVSNAAVFATKSLDGTDDNGTGYNVDVFLSANGDSVQARRVGTVGTARVQATVVAFDPAQVRVQAGTFTIAGGDVMGSAQIPAAVDPTRTFSLFSYEAATTRGDHRSSSLTSVLDPTELRFERAEFDDVVNGHWYAVEALGGAFAVTHVQMPDIESTFTMSDTTVPAVDPNRAFVLHSYMMRPGSASSGHADCGLLDATTVRCERTNSTGSLRDINAQVIELTTGRVELQAASTINATQTLPLAMAVDPDRSVIVAPAQGMFGMGRTDAGTDRAGYARLLLTGGGSQILLSRENTSGEFNLRFSVVEFPQ